jgi:hypothetical protein
LLAAPLEAAQQSLPALAAEPAGGTQPGLLHPAAQPADQPEQSLVAGVPGRAGQDFEQLVVDLEVPGIPQALPEIPERPAGQTAPAPGEIRAPHAQCGIQPAGSHAGVVNGLGVRPFPGAAHGLPENADPVPEIRRDPFAHRIGECGGRLVYQEAHGECDRAAAARASRPCASDLRMAETRWQR